MSFSLKNWSFNRDWRYHKEERVWITRAPGMEPTMKTNTYERGTYYFFDCLNWRKVAKVYILFMCKCINQELKKKWPLLSVYMYQCIHFSNVPGIWSFVSTSSAWFNSRRVCRNCSFHSQLEKWLNLVRNFVIFQKPAWHFKYFCFYSVVK